MSEYDPEMLPSSDSDDANPVKPLEHTLYRDMPEPKDNQTEQDAYQMPPPSLHGGFCIYDRIINNKTPVTMEMDTAASTPKTDRELPRLRAVRPLADESDSENTDETSQAHRNYDVVLTRRYREQKQNRRRIQKKYKQRALHCHGRPRNELKELLRDV